MSRPRGRMPSEWRWAMGKIGKGRAQLDPIWRENTDVRSGLWPEPWTAQAKGPSARAVGQEGEPKEPDVSRANKRGRRPLVLFAKESGSCQSHSPQPEGRAKPRRGQSPRVPCGVAASNASPLVLAFGVTPPGSRTSEYATLCEPTASHHIVNLRGTLAPLTLALSQGERGQRRRERQQAGKRKGAGQAPFDALIG